jgi:hypothetical protein
MELLNLIGGDAKKYGTQNLSLLWQNLYLASRKRYHPCRQRRPTSESPLGTRLSETSPLERQDENVF